MLSLDILPSKDSICVILFDVNLSRFVCIVYEPYGDMNDLRAIVDGIHERGMKVIFDLVMNHTR